jgi:predicted metalloprotease with PDZ domain
MKTRFMDRITAEPRFMQQMSLQYLSEMASTRYSEDFRFGSSVFSRGALMAYEMDSLIKQKTTQRKSLRGKLHCYLY